MRFLPLLLSLLVFIGACEKEQGPPVVISDVRVIAPMPGSTMGVGYMSIANRGEEPITVDAVSSPQFEKVEMHETTITDGISCANPEWRNYRIRSGWQAPDVDGCDSGYSAGVASDPGNQSQQRIAHR